MRLFNIVRNPVVLIKKTIDVFRTGGLRIIFIKSGIFLNNLVSFARRRFESGGLRYILLVSGILVNYPVSFIRRREFSYLGNEYRYFYHPYNHTWLNERAIEIPIVMRDILNSKSGEILEVGNVLQNYVMFEHDILDKYDPTPGVINKDIVGFEAGKKYDLIVSISTLEHVGWDESPKDSFKIPLAIRSMRNNLKKNGRIIATVPLGYNKFLDRIIEEAREFDKAYFMKRSVFNRWKQVCYDEVRGLKYSKSITANSLAIIIIDNQQIF